MTTMRTALPLSFRVCGGGDCLGVERVLRRTPGVQDAYVNPATEMAYVEYDPSVTTHDALLETLREAKLT